MGTDIRERFKAMSRRLARVPPPRGLRGDAARAYGLGRDHAPIFVLFIAWGMETCLERGCGTVWYFTREGEFFRALHERVAGASRRGGETPRAVLLETSRLATFGPSLGALSIAGMRRFWAQYPVQSMRALLATLAVSPGGLDGVIRAHGLEPDAAVSFPWRDARVRGLFADPAFRDVVDAALRERRRNLVDYLKERGFFTESGRDRFVVDIGWRGSTQDNLARLCPGYRLHGAYLGLQTFINAQPDNVRKDAFGPDCNREGAPARRLLDPMLFFEMLCNSPGGTTTGYVRRDGRMAAVRHMEPGDAAVYAAFTRHYQRGVLDAAPMVCAALGAGGVTAAALRFPVLRLLEDVVFSPDRLLARTYFSLERTERFGAVPYADAAARFPYALFFAGLASAAKRAAFLGALAATGWPQGVLAAGGHAWLTPLYNALVLRRRGAPSPWAGR